MAATPDGSLLAPAQCLQQELLGMVFSYLAASDIYACMATCRNWHQAATDDAVWKVYIRDRYLLQSLGGGSGPKKLGTVSLCDRPPSTCREHVHALHAKEHRCLQLVRQLQRGTYEVNEQMTDAIVDLLAGTIPRPGVGGSPPFFASVDRARSVVSFPDANESDVSLHVERQELCCRAPAAPDVADMLWYMRDNLGRPLSERQAAGRLLRRLRWRWILEELVPMELSPLLSSPSSPSSDGRKQGGGRLRPDQLGKAMALVSASRLLHLDPATQVVVPLLAQLELLAHQFPNRLRGRPRWQRVKELFHFLFGSGPGCVGLRGEPEAYYWVGHSFLHVVLRRRRGSPIALCVVAYEVGRRVKPPIQLDPVNFPHHFLLRCFDEDAQIYRYLDPFGYSDETGTVSEESIANDDTIPSWAGTAEEWQARLTAARIPFRSEFLEPTTANAVLSRVLHNLYYSLTSESTGIPPPSRRQRPRRPSTTSHAPSAASASTTTNTSATAAAEAGYLERVAQAEGEGDRGGEDDEDVDEENEGEALDSHLPGDLLYVATSLLVRLDALAPRWSLRFVRLRLLERLGLFLDIPDVLEEVRWLEGQGARGAAWPTLVPGSMAVMTASSAPTGSEGNGDPAMPPSALPSTAHPTPGMADGVPMLAIPNPPSRQRSIPEARLNRIREMILPLTLVTRQSTLQAYYPQGYRDDEGGEETEDGPGNERERRERRARGASGASGIPSTTDPVDRMENDPENEGEEERPPSLHPVGLPFRHRSYRYLSIILTQSKRCEADDRWQMHMRVAELPHGADQPFYASLVLEDRSIRYVAHENIIPLTSEEYPLLIDLVPALAPGEKPTPWSHVRFPHNPSLPEIAVPRAAVRWMVEVTRDENDQHVAVVGPEPFAIGSLGQEGVPSTGFSVTSAVVGEGGAKRNPKNFFTHMADWPIWEKVAHDLGQFFDGLDPIQGRMRPAPGINDDAESTEE